MAITYTASTINEYLRKRLMPVEGAIPHVQGIEMYAREPRGGCHATVKVVVERYWKTANKR
jgi:hypothetical protein